MATERQEMIELLKELGIDYRYITCDECIGKDECEFVYDAWNTDGDCLGLK